jgi:hypothetical protein
MREQKTYLRVYEVIVVTTMINGKKLHLYTLIRYCKSVDDILYRWSAHVLVIATENTIVFHIVLDNMFVVLVVRDNIQDGLWRSIVALGMLWSELGSYLAIVALLLLTKHRHTTTGISTISAFPKSERFSCKNVFHKKSLQSHVYFCTKKRIMVEKRLMHIHLDEDECTKVAFKKWTQLWPNRTNTYRIKMDNQAS